MSFNRKLRVSFRRLSSWDKSSSSSRQVSSRSNTRPTTTPASPTPLISSDQPCSCSCSSSEARTHTTTVMSHRYPGSRKAQQDAFQEFLKAEELRFEQARRQHHRETTSNLKRHISEQVVVAVVTPAPDQRMPSLLAVLVQAA